MAEKNEKPNYIDDVLIRLTAEQVDTVNEMLKKFAIDNGKVKSKAILNGFILDNDEYHWQYVSSEGTPSYEPMPFVEVGNQNLDTYPKRHVKYGAQVPPDENYVYKIMHWGETGDSRYEQNGLGILTDPQVKKILEIIATSSGSYKENDWTYSLTGTDENRKNNTDAPRSKVTLDMRDRRLDDPNQTLELAGNVTVGISDDPEMRSKFTVMGETEGQDGTVFGRLVDFYGEGGQLDSEEKVKDQLEHWGHQIPNENWPKIYMNRGEDRFNGEDWIDGYSLTGSQIGRKVEIQLSQGWSYDPEEKVWKHDGVTSTAPVEIDYENKQITSNGAKIGNLVITGANYGLGLGTVESIREIVSHTTISADHGIIIEDGVGDSTDKGISKWIIKNSENKILDTTFMVDGQDTHNTAQFGLQIKHDGARIQGHTFIQDEVDKNQFKLKNGSVCYPNTATGADTPVKSSNIIRGCWFCLTNNPGEGQVKDWQYGHWCTNKDGQNMYVIDMWPGFLYHKIKKSIPLIGSTEKDVYIYTVEENGQRVEYVLLEQLDKSYKRKKVKSISDWESNDYYVDNQSTIQETDDIFYINEKKVVNKHYMPGFGSNNRSTLGEFVTNGASDDNERIIDYKTEVNERIIPELHKVYQMGADAAYTSPAFPNGQTDPKESDIPFRLLPAEQSVNNLDYIYWDGIHFHKITTNYPNYKANAAYGSLTVGIRKDSKIKANDTIGKHALEVGTEVEATGSNAVATGDSTKAIGNNSHAEGKATSTEPTIEIQDTPPESVSGCAHAEGHQTRAGRWAAHAEGYNTLASGPAAHAEGYGSDNVKTVASGEGSHAEGKGTKAEGNFSHAEGSTALELYKFVNSKWESSTDTPSESAIIAYVPTFDQLPSTAKNDDYGIVVRGRALGNYSHSEGFGTIAYGAQSHAEGEGTVAQGTTSHAEGYQTEATNYYAHAEGKQTEAFGLASHAEGVETKASGKASHAEGIFITVNNNKIITTAEGEGSHAEGGGTYAKSIYSHAEGNLTKAQGRYSHAEGNETITFAYAQSAHAEGENTSAQGQASHVEGTHTSTSLSGGYGHAEGHYTQANGIAAHAEGGYLTNEQGSPITNKPTIASGASSHAEGFGTKAINVAAHAEGIETQANGYSSHAEGNFTTTLGMYSHAEGDQTLAGAESSHAEGASTHAASIYSHAEGVQTTAGGEASHSEGSATSAIGDYSHAEGCAVEVFGYAAHGEGYSNSIGEDGEEYGSYSHVEGISNTVKNTASHAEGMGNETNRDYQHLQGKYSSTAQYTYTDKTGSHTENIRFAVGNGSTASARANAFEVTENGDAVVQRHFEVDGTSDLSDKVTIGDNVSNHEVALEVLKHSEFDQNVTIERDGSPSVANLDTQMAWNTQPDNSLKVKGQSLFGDTVTIGKVGTTFENHLTGDLYNRHSTFAGLKVYGEIYNPRIPDELYTSMPINGLPVLNQFADKFFVNSSIATATATFRGSYDATMYNPHKVVSIEETADFTTKLAHGYYDVKTFEHNLPTKYTNQIIYEEAITVATLAALEQIQDPDTTKVYYVEENHKHYRYNLKDTTWVETSDKPVIFHLTAIDGWTPNIEIHPYETGHPYTAGYYKFYYDKEVSPETPLVDTKDEASKVAWLNEHLKNEYIDSVIPRDHKINRKEELPGWEHQAPANAGVWYIISEDTFYEADNSDWKECYPVADNNDYCFFQIWDMKPAEPYMLFAEKVMYDDPDHPIDPVGTEVEPDVMDREAEMEIICERYKFIVVTHPTTGAMTSHTWKFEYQLNNSGFTQAQWAAINSGISPAWMSDIQGQIDKEIEDRKEGDAQLRSEILITQRRWVKFEEPGNLTHPIYVGRDSTNTYYVTKQCAYELAANTYSTSKHTQAYLAIYDNGYYYNNQITVPATTGNQTVAFQSYVDSAIEGLSNTYYNKNEIDNNFYTKTHINNNFYTKTQSDSRYSFIGHEHNNYVTLTTRQDGTVVGATEYPPITGKKKFANSDGIGINNSWLKGGAANKTFSLPSILPSGDSGELALKSAIPTNYVTTNTEQISINGKKNFTNTDGLGIGGSYIKANATKGTFSLPNTSSGTLALVSQIPNMNNYFNKTEINTLLGDYALKTYVDSKLGSCTTTTVYINYTQTLDNVEKYNQNFTAEGYDFGNFIIFHTSLPIPKKGTWEASSRCNWIKFYATAADRTNGIDNKYKLIMGHPYVTASSVKLEDIWNVENLVAFWSFVTGDDKNIQFMGILVKVY